MQPTSLTYCDSLFKFRRRRTFEVRIGDLIMGHNYPIRVQSMTTTNTLDTEGTVNQALKIVEAGGELVRITTQGRREAANLEPIRDKLRQMGCNVPLVADIHFNPNAAEIAAKLIEKVRINPGNFADGAKKFATTDTSDEAWQAGIDAIREKFIPFLNTCKQHNTAIRIGTNHGSLSDRIMSRYGDTPEGMVESCMEYLRICREQNFINVVLSIKSSNTRVMVHTVRLLVARMNQEEMYYPLHLGVTEAGNGDDGRIKSAVGIGALLADGIGDTIRVSLTEDPELEIPVAIKLVNYINKRDQSPAIPYSGSGEYNFTPYSYNRQVTHAIGNIGALNVPVVIQKITKVPTDTTLKADYLLCNTVTLAKQAVEQGFKAICKDDTLPEGESFFPLFDVFNFKVIDQPNFLLINLAELSGEIVELIKQSKQTVLMVKTSEINTLAEHRAFIWKLNQHNINNPVIISRNYDEKNIEDLQIQAGADNGILFLDGMADGLMIQADDIDENVVLSTAFGILQASRVRFSKTEYISCPGCGRTLFDLQTVTAQIKARTSHLKELKIGIMGCIVNGIGEMADADYGYIGSGPGTVSLFKQKEMIKRNVPSENALEELIELIKSNGDWKEEQ